MTQARMAPYFFYEVGRNHYHFPLRSDYPEEFVGIEDVALFQEFSTMLDELTDALLTREVKKPPRVDDWKLVPAIISDGVECYHEQYGGYKVDQWLFPG